MNLSSEVTEIDCRDRKGKWLSHKVMMVHQVLEWFRHFQQEMQHGVANLKSARSVVWQFCILRCLRLWQFHRFLFQLARVFLYASSWVMNHLGNPTTFSDSSDGFWPESETTVGYESKARILVFYTLNSRCWMVLLEESRVFVVLNPHYFRWPTDLPPIETTLRTLA